MSSTDVHRSITWTARAVTYLLYAIVVINEIILLLGFTLKLFGANPSAGFTQWAYRNLDRVMEPFRGIFPGVEVGTGTADVQPVLDTSILFAMLIYLILGMALRSLIDWLAYRLAGIEMRRAQEEADARAQERLLAQQAAQAAAVPAAETTAVVYGTVTYPTATTVTYSPSGTPTGQVPPGQPPRQVL